MNLAQNGNKINAIPNNNEGNPSSSGSIEIDINDSVPLDGIIDKIVQYSEIYELNDDCLLYIFSYLNIYDLFNLYRVSVRLKNLVEVHFKSYKKLILNLRQLNLDYIENIFNLIVIPNINYLHISGGSSVHNDIQNKLIRNIPRCRKLEQLNLLYFRISYGTLEPFQNILENLICLNLSRCDIDDDTMRLFIGLRNLKKLNLSGSNSLKGVNFPLLEARLTHLALEFCRNLESSYLIEYLIKNENNLQLLDLSFNNNLFLNNIMDVIVQHQPNLTEIRLNELHCSNFLPIIQLRKLRKISCHQTTTYTLKRNLDALIVDLSETHKSLIDLDISFCEINLIGQQSLKAFTSLETLKLKRLQVGNGNFDFLTGLKSLGTLRHLDVSYCDLTNEHCIEIVRKGWNLKFLNLENNSVVTHAFLELCLEALAAQKDRKFKLKVNIRRTQILQETRSLPIAGMLVIEF